MLSLSLFSTGSVDSTWQTAFSLSLFYHAACDVEIAEIPLLHANGKGVCSVFIYLFMLYPLLKY